MFVLKVEMVPTVDGTYTADDEFIKVHRRGLYDNVMQGVLLRASCGKVFSPKHVSTTSMFQARRP